MPLQNRVDPFGQVHAVAARGMFTGNRGVIHDPDTKMLLSRRWTTKAWIICDCSFKGRKRDVFGRNTQSGSAGWTNLFFLDEVTALAAGHRPCFECRREKAKEFADCFGKAFGIAKPRVAEIDARLHNERLAAAATSRTVFPENLTGLPEGAMLANGARPYAVLKEAVLPWSLVGYGAALPFSARDPASWVLLTPVSAVSVMRAGYRPIWHPTASW